MNSVMLCASHTSSLESQSDRNINKPQALLRTIDVVLVNMLRQWFLLRLRGKKAAKTTRNTALHPNEIDAVSNKAYTIDKSAQLRPWFLAPEGLGLRPFGTLEFLQISNVRHIETTIVDASICRNFR